MRSLNRLSLLGLLRGGAAALIYLAAPASAGAQQAASCRVPDPMPVPRAVSIPRGEAVASVRPSGYLLALSWSPQYCATVRDPQSVQNRDQCALPKQTGFWKSSQPSDAPYAWILHGLWPQSAEGPHPQWCRSTRVVPKEILRRNFCISPSAQLMQHQWAKHGSCMADNPSAYFQSGADLFHKMRFPDMKQLARTAQNSASIRRAFAARNSGTSEQMFSVHTDRDGWLRDVRLCLNAAMRPTVCRPNQRGLMGPRPVMVRPASD